MSAFSRPGLEPAVQRVFKEGFRYPEMVEKVAHYHSVPAERGKIAFDLYRMADAVREADG